MQFLVREMTLDDYYSVIELWRKTEGICLSEADSRENIEKFLKRNPQLSYVVEWQNNLLGTILCGHDGRRGYLHHLAVKKEYRNRGLGRQLVNKCLEQLALLKIHKCHLFVFKNNESGLKFWEHLCFNKRTDIEIVSKETIVAEGYRRGVKNG